MFSPWLLYGRILLTFLKAMGEHDPKEGAQGGGAQGDGAQAALLIFGAEPKVFAF